MYFLSTTSAEIYTEMKYIMKFPWYYYTKTMVFLCTKKLIECSNILQLSMLLFIAKYFNQSPRNFVSFNLETGLQLFFRL